MVVSMQSIPILFYDIIEGSSEKDKDSSGCSLPEKAGKTMIDANFHG